MASSARAGSDRDTVIASAFVILRLITGLYLVSACAARSAPTPFQMVHEHKFELFP
jgi:hypothetical protein